MAANRGVDPWLPGADRRIVLPSFELLPDVPRRGIVINLAEERLFYFPPGGGSVEVYPIGVGVQGRATPIGTTVVVRKEANPAWYPPPSIRVEEPDLPTVVPAGDDNPLGAFALYLGWPAYLIHGTNKPDGVGRDSSHGCIRLYPEDIERLFHEVRGGTGVRVIAQEVKVAWIGDSLYVQVHPNSDQSHEIAVSASFTSTVPRDLVARVANAAGAFEELIDWGVVRRAGLERTGIPVPIARLPSGSGTRPEIASGRGQVSDQ
jgi:L,D-transpeptidase ErfK/SrfK